MGLRNRPHGSQLARGITLTPGNSSCAFLGRSPPRSVFTMRTISPRFSKPAAINGSYTRCDTTGFVAMNTCAPGTTTRMRRCPNRSKNARMPARSASLSAVKRGSGCRVAPSKSGGMRHTPPRPLRRLASWSGVYSTTPYGGSVTTASIEFAGAPSSHSKASTRWMDQSPVVGTFVTMRTASGETATILNQAFAAVQ